VNGLVFSIGLTAGVAALSELEVDGMLVLVVAVMASSEKLSSAVESPRRYARYHNAVAASTKSTITGAIIYILDNPLMDDVGVSIHEWYRIYIM